MKILYVLGFLVLLSHLSYADEYSGAVQSLQKNFAVRQLSHEKHRGYILDHGSKTDKVLVLIHALYESPAYIRGVANFFYEAGYNVIVPVLAGHWESPLEKLDDATGSEWIQDTAEVIAHAKLMGSSLIVGGHSLGGLIAVYRAMKDPSIDGLVLWSPAMKLSNKVWFGSYIGWLLKDLKRLDGNWLAGKPPKDGVNVPYYSVAVGVEVARLGKQLLSDFTTIHHPSWWVNADSSELYESLKMPVAVIGT